MFTIAASLLAATITVSPPLTIRDGILNNRGPFSNAVTFTQASDGFLTTWHEVRSDGDHLFVATLPSTVATIDPKDVVDLGPSALGAQIGAGDGLLAVMTAARIRLYDRNWNPISQPTAQVTGGGSLLPVWNGRDFVISGSTRPTFVDTTGTLRQGAPITGSSGQLQGVAFAAPRPGGGTTLMASDVCGFGCFLVHVNVLQLDANDQILSDVQIADSGTPQFNDNMVLVTSDRGSIAVYFDRAQAGRYAALLDAGGALKKTVLLKTDINSQGFSSPVQVAGDGSEWLVFDPLAKQLTLIDGDGNVLVPPMPIDTQISPRLARTGPGSYVIAQLTAYNTIYSRIELLHLQTQRTRHRGAAH